MRTKCTSGLDLLVQPSWVEASLWRRYRYEAEGSCRELLFNRYVGLAKSVARRHFYRRGVKRVEQADFEQFAFEGLLQAIDRFDPLKGVPFGSYARRRIVGSIADGMAKMSEIDAQISQRHRIEQERLRSLATVETIAAEGDALAALADLAVGLALGMMLEGTCLVEGEGGVDPRPSAYESLEWRELQARLVKEVAQLPEKEAIIIRQHYDNGLSFGQIAELLELSRGRISQLHRSALERLRRRVGAFN